MGKNNIGSTGGGGGKWHIRTKRSNAIIWHYRERIIINVSIFTFQKTLLFIKLSVTIEEAVSGLLGDQVGVNYLQSQIGF